MIRRLLVILGPTSTGKTDLALKLAKKFNGELVSCDSRQVYKGLDIGTGKMPSELKIEKGNGWWQVNGGKIWMYDVADWRKQYTVYDYVNDASKIINQILKRGKLPIIVGGTGLYFKALLEGLPTLEIPVNLKLRKALEKLSLHQLQDRLQKSTERWEKMNNSDRQNPRRLTRAMEIASADFTSEESLRATVRGGFKKNFNILKIGLTAPREILYKRIDERVINRLDQGMIEESEKLHKRGLSFERMKQLGLEYGILADYLQGKISEIELVKVLQGKIHGYARRQITWFKKEKDVFLFDITQSDWCEQLENKVSSWYYLVNDQTY